MQTINLSGFESVEHYGIREIQLAHIKECSQVSLQWIFKIDNLNITRLLARKIITVPIIVMNGELCLGIAFLVQHSGQFLTGNGRMRVSAFFRSTVVNEKSRVSALDRKSVWTIAR
jgi:hypothetical protein